MSQIFVPPKFIIVFLKVVKELMENEKSIKLTDGLWIEIVRKMEDYPETGTSLKEKYFKMIAPAIQENNYGYPDDFIQNVLGLFANINTNVNTDELIVSSEEQEEVDGETVQSVSSTATVYHEAVDDDFQPAIPNVEYVGIGDDIDTFASVLIDYEDIVNPLMTQKQDETEEDIPPLNEVEEVQEPGTSESNSSSAIFPPPASTEDFYENNKLTSTQISEDSEGSNPLFDIGKSAESSSAREKYGKSQENKENSEVSWAATIRDIKSDPNWEKLIPKTGTFKFTKELISHFVDIPDNPIPEPIDEESRKARNLDYYKRYKAYIVANKIENEYATKVRLAHLERKFKIETQNPQKILL